MAASNIIESFFVALGFQVDTQGLEDMKKKTDELRDSAMKVGAVFTGAAAGIGLLVQGVAASMGDLYSFAELNEVSARSVASLGKIAQENDGSLEGMKSTIQSLNKMIGEASLGIGRGAMTFEKLNLAAKRADGSVKSVDDILAEVADKMQGLSRQEQIAMAEKLGIDPQFVKVLEKGSANLAKLREEAEMLNPFTEEDYKLADEVDKLFIKAKNTLGVFTKMLGVSLLPTVKEVLKNYLEWFKASRKATSDVFVRALKLIAGAIGTVWDWVVRLVTGMKAAYDWIIQFKLVTYLAAAALTAFVAVKTYDFVIQLGSAIKALTLRMVAFNASALLIPAIIGAIILAVGLLIDDYVNWKEGNDSVIGGLIEQFPWLLDVIQTIEKAVGEMVDFWLQQWETLAPPLMQLAGSIWELIKVVYSLLWPVVKMVFEGWAYIMAAVIPIIAAIIAWIAENLVGAIVAVINVATWMAEAFTTVFNGIKTGIDMIVNAFDWAKQKVTGFIDMVTGAISKVGSLLGLTDDASKVKIAVNSGGGSSADAATANNSLNSTGGVIGSAGGTSNSSSTVSSTTQITGTTIQINSPDPTKAGEAVKQELDKMNKQTVRNGQSAVAL
jgi:phage-related protein